MADGLTVGVEWEFAFCFLEGSSPDPWDGMDVAGARLTQPLLRLTPNDRSNSQAVHGSLKQVIENDIEVITLSNAAVLAPLTDKHEREYSKSELGSSWIVKPEYCMDIEYEEPVRFTWIGLELNSPILESNDADTFRILDRVTRVLKQECRLRLNTSCALHVHVGSRSNPSFTALHIKKLRTLLWLAEERLGELCHPDRTRPIYATRILRPKLRDEAKLAEEGLLTTTDLTEHPLDDFAKWMESALWDTSDADLTGRLMVFWSDSNDTVEAVCKWLACSEGWKMAYNFDGIQLAKKGPPSPGLPGPLYKETLEFRCMEGTLSPHTVIHWVKVCTRIVHWARVANVAEFGEVIRQLQAGTDVYSVLDLLGAIGCEAATVDHFREKMGNDHMRCCNHSLKEFFDVVPTRCHNAAHNTDAF